jgi:DNA-binding IclR family transcriptional regulator
MVMTMEKGIVVHRRRRPKNTTNGTRSLTSNHYSSKALTRALDVLECFSDEYTALSLKDLRCRHDIPESSLYRTLATLELRGYLVQSSDGTYRISPRLLYGKVRERAEELRDIARPHLEVLGARFDETASLSCLFEDRIQVVDTVETLHSMRLTNRPGRVLPPHCSSMGKSITAFQTPEKTNNILEVYGLVRRTPKTITDRAALFAEFARIREQGYAFDREEATEGGVCVGAPIRCEGKPVIAALSLSMPLVRYNLELEKSIVASVTATAEAVAAALRR